MQNLRCTVLLSKGTTDKQIPQIGSKTELPAISCKFLIDDNPDYVVCDVKNNFNEKYQTLIRGNIFFYKDKLIKSNINEYIVSPLSKSVLLNSGGVNDPFVSSLYLLNIQNGSIKVLFKNIISAYEKNSWSSDGNKILIVGSEFDSSGQQIANKVEGLFKLYDCSISGVCKVLAHDAGSIGVSGDPACYKNGKVCYKKGFEGEPFCFD